MTEGSIVVEPQPRNTSSNPAEMVDDPQTRHVVATQEKGEAILLWLIIAYGVASCAREVYVSHFDWPTVILMPIATYLGMAILNAAVKRLLFRPIRALRFGACERRLQAEVRRTTQWNTFKYPCPALLALDSGRRRLVVENRQTGFRRLFLGPEQIIEAKVEREQSIETVTRHGPQTIFFPFDSSFGIISGGRSRSSSTIFETAYLEITYLPHQTAGIHRLVFDFGGSRRLAENWVLEIERLRRAAG